MFVFSSVAVFPTLMFMNSAKEEGRRSDSHCKFRGRGVAKMINPHFQIALAFARLGECSSVVQ
jgi:hypothetical protein